MDSNELKRRYVSPSLQIVKVFSKSQILVGSVYNEIIFEEDIDLDD